MMKAPGRMLLFCTIILAAQSLDGAAAQDKTSPAGRNAKKLEQRCNPKIVKKAKLKDKPVQIREGEKSTGYTPLVTFQITAAGDVVNVHLKRSSGIHDVDQAALKWVGATTYSSRPGCPVIESEADVLIDYR